MNSQELYFFRFQRISLRTFLISFTLVCVGCGLILPKMQARRLAIQKVGELGGTVAFSSTWDGCEWSFITPLPNDTKSGLDNSLFYGSWYDEVTAIKFFDLQIKENAEAFINDSDSVEFVTDADLKILVNFPNLQQLDICSYEIQELDHIVFQDLKKLRFLTLVHRYLDDDAFTAISECFNLEEITIIAHDISIHSLRSLMRLPKLRSISLNVNALTSEHLHELCKFPSLDDISVTGTDSVSASAKKAFKIRFPKAIVFP